MKIDNHENWQYMADTPQEFANAIKNAISDNERVFFKKLLYKILNEPAASNDVLLDGENNEGVYIIRISDDFIIGAIQQGDSNIIPGSSREYSGLFYFLEQDMFPYIGYHLTVRDWLRERDYVGINYSGNNDLI